LFNIENLSTVLVVANAPETEVARIRIGQRAEITVPAYPGRRFAGTVQSIASHLDEKTRTLAVRCLVDNSERRLRPDMFAQVVLTTGDSRGIVSVPLTAIEEDGQDRFLYVEQSGGFVRRPIQVGITSEGVVEVVSGLRQGERVVVAGVFVLKSEANRDKLKGDD